MRSEQDGRLRRRTERDHAAITSAGSTSNYDSTSPREAVSAIAVSGKVWCNENLRRSEVLCFTRTKSAATAVEGGTAQSSLERSVA